MEYDRRQSLEGTARLVLASLFGPMGKELRVSQAFLDRDGHCRVPKSYKPTTVIGSVTGSVGKEKSKDAMEPDRRQRFEALPDWSWDVLSDNGKMASHI